MFRTQYKTREGTMADLPMPSPRVLAMLKHFNESPTEQMAAISAVMASGPDGKPDVQAYRRAKTAIASKRQDNEAMKQSMRECALCTKTLDSKSRGWRPYCSSQCYTVAEDIGRNPDTFVIKR